MPAPRSIEPAVSAAPSVIASLPVPPVMVSTFETVALLVPLNSVSASVAGAEIDGGGGQRRGDGDLVVQAAAGDLLGVRHADACWCQSDERMSASVPALRLTVPVQRGRDA